MSKKGRNKRLLHNRNIKLIERYYYWTEIQRRRFDDVLNILSEQEFFIEKSTIVNVLNQYNDRLNQLIEEKNKDSNNVKNQLKLF